MASVLPYSDLLLLNRRTTNLQPNFHQEDNAQRPQDAYSLWEMYNCSDRLHHFVLVLVRNTQLSEIIGAKDMNSSSINNNNSSLHEEKTMISWLILGWERCRMSYLRYVFICYVTQLLTKIRFKCSYDEWGWIGYVTN